MPTIVTILRDLWRLRRVVAVICLAAVLLGLAVGFRMSFPPRLESRQYHVGVATTRLLVDTPTSQVIEVAPKGSDTLVSRATLLASLMTDGVVKDAIARRAGLPSAQLQTVSGSATADTPGKPANPRGYVLTTTVLMSTGGDQLPIIQIDTQAPDAKGAGSLANAAVVGLRDYLDSQATDVPVARRLRVTGLGGAQAGTAVRGPGHIIALVVMVLLFALGCGVLLAVRAVVRDWRAVAQEGAPPKPKRESRRDDPGSLAVVADASEPKGTSGRAAANGRRPRATSGASQPAADRSSASRKPSTGSRERSTPARKARAN